MARTTALPRSRRIAASAALLLLAVPLSACSASGLLGLNGNGSSGGSAAGDGANGSAVGSQCQVASAAIDSAIEEAKQSAPQLVAEAIAGEPIDASAIVSPVVESIAAASASITDPAVLTALEEAQAEWTGLAGDITTLRAPDMSGLSEGDLGSLSDLQAYGEELSRMYSERLPALQETGANLQQACQAE